MFYEEFSVASDPSFRFFRLAFVAMFERKTLLELRHNFNDIICPIDIRHVFKKRIARVWMFIIIDTEMQAHIPLVIVYEYDHTYSSRHVSLEKERLTNNELYGHDFGRLAICNRNLTHLSYV